MVSRKMTIPMVLLYHIVLPLPANADPEERGLFVNPDLFASQMEDLHQRGFRTLTLDQFRSAVDGNLVSPKGFLLTFDDAYAHVDLSVTPLLHHFGFSAVMFAPLRHLGGRNVWDHQHRNLARLEISSDSQLKAMIGDGWEIASHGVRHIDLSTLSAPERTAELSMARERLADLIGRPVMDLAYPYGTCNEAVRDDARKAGYLTGFLMGRSKQPDRLQLPRRPIRGDEGMSIFRLKTSPFSSAAYELGGFVPAWAKAPGRRLIH
jgi:peptidoglycan/xylan/chitin deacetylase (PgdA/CDA1 family)